MRLQRNLLPLLLLLFFASGALAFGYTKAKTWFKHQTAKAPQKIKFLSEPVILGSFLTDTLPEVERANFGSPSAQPTATPKPLGEALAQETEKIVKGVLDNVSEAVKEAVVKNISINQEKIVQDVTAKLLQSLLTQTGTVGQPVDRAVYDACTNIVKTAENTPSP